MYINPGPPYHYKMLWYILASVFSLVYLVKLYLRTRTGVCRCKNRLDGKLIVVTGANTGIGYETAKDLAARGARVILACRDKSRGTTAAANIAKETGGQVQFKQLNLASLHSVRAFAAELIANETHIDILINNAGVGRVNNTLTEDGIVIEAQINHFAPFLITNLLLPLLKSAQQGRIINVSSVMHKLGYVNLETLTKVAPNVVAHQKAYANAKLCNLLFSLELKRRLIGSNVTVNTLHPGVVNTGIYRNMFFLMRIVMKFLVPKTAWEGAQTSIHLAVSPHLNKVSGQYFEDCKPSVPSKSADDAVMAAKLWEFSEKIVNNT